MGAYFIGLMSGTSLDGVDGVVVQFEPHLRVHAHVSMPFTPALRNTLLALNTVVSQQSPATGSQDLLHEAALASNALSRCYAQVCDALLEHSHLTPGEIRAIGSHGQTVKHQPQAHDGVGYSLQLQAPALLAELTGIDVIADFRSRDIAAGGQGAPLAPAFHAAVFAHPTQTRWILNIGGFANLTLLQPGHAVRGFDCGPGNVLMDAWCQHHLGSAFDRDGHWASQGQVQPDLLHLCLSDPFFHQPPPKSTGRDHFHLDWLRMLLHRWTQAHAGALPKAVDVQATLCELTAQVCAKEALEGAPQASTVLVCGGGALNGQLMRRLQALLPPQMQVAPSTQMGLPPLQVEACAFAWLARTHLLRQAGNHPDVTGARGPRVLGAHYPA